MTDESTMIDVMESRARRRVDRRDFFMRMGGSAFVAGATALSSTAAEAQTAAPTDNDVLNFALNLEYLEAQFYSYASFGNGLDNTLLTGTGTQGGLQAFGARAVPFQDPIVRQYAREIANDEIAHVKFLRQALTVNNVSAAVATPVIDISINANGAFSSAARSAKLITGPDSTFDPYLNDENFLLGAFIFEDVGVTAYKGAAGLLTNKTFLEAAAGILAVEAYHSSIVRTTLYGKGVAMPMLRTSADAISDARDSLDGTTDLDQGISPRNGASNIVPLDKDGLAFSRTTGQVLNIVYLNSMAVNGGGFFPNGVNGTIKASAAN